MKFLKNECYGGFRLSDACFEWLIENKNYTTTTYNKETKECENPAADILIMEWPKYTLMKFDTYDPLFRTNLDIIEAVETVGLDKASNNVSKIVIVDIPEGIEVEITEYDGYETVREIPKQLIREW